MRIRGLFLLCISAIGSVAIAGGLFFAVTEWTRWDHAANAKALMQVFGNLARLNERVSIERGDFNQIILVDEAAGAPLMQSAIKDLALVDESVAAIQATKAALAVDDAVMVDKAFARIQASIRSTRATAQEQAGKAKAQRDPQVHARYIADSIAILGEISRLSDTVEVRTADIDPAIGRFAQLVRLSLTLRDLGGRRSTMITNFVGNKKQYTAAETEQFLLYEGQIFATWVSLQQAARQLDSVPGIATAVERANVDFIQGLGQSTREAYQRAVAGSDPGITMEAWRNRIRATLAPALAPRDAALSAAAALSDEVIVAARTRFIIACLAVVGILALVIGFAIYITRRVVQPIRTLAVGIEQISKGIYDVEMPSLTRRDEIGEIGRAVEVLRANSREMVRLQDEQVSVRSQADEDRRRAFQEVADELDRVVGRIAGAVSSTSEELQASARGMSVMAEQTSSRSGQATQASQVANDMVGAVAAAAEELSASVTEIGARVKESARIAGVAVTEANDAASKVTTMSEAARRIGDILRLITDIAGQTNLLALNATIEAARAGEAGRGFAVVASEVKNLAEQTSKATAEIEAQISTVQRATDEAVSAITGIASTIGQMNEISTSIASAVSQQSAATDEIASSIARASEGTRDASENMLQVNQTAAETGSAASQVLGASTELSRTSGELRVATDNFVARIRAV